MRKDIFKWKLQSYSTLAGSMIAVKFSANAQILYTDVSPDDTLFFHQYYPLDLNNDGVVDFYLSEGQQPPSDYVHGAQIFNTGSGSLNSVLGVVTQTITNTSSSKFVMKLPFRLSFNYLIDSNLGWVKPNKFEWAEIDFQLDPYEQAILNAIFWTSTFYGYWQNNVGDRYLGLRIKLNDSLYYGWARLEVDSAANWIVLKDYAINLTPDSSILAGEGIPTTGINQEINFDFNVFPNPASSALFISGLYESHCETEATLIDLSGRRLLAQRISPSQNKIEISALSDGFYFLELKNEDQTLVKKVEIKH